MYQQVNFYRTEFLTRTDRLGAGTLMAFGGVVVAAMVAAYLYASYEMMNVKSELKIAEGQERAAISRLENFDPNAEGGDQATWERQLEDAKRALQDQELVLNMVVDSSLGDIDGFSRYLSSLARMNTDGLWLSRIRLSALGDSTRLEGQAIRAELIPLYLQQLALEDPFADQRFYEFLIDRPQKEEGGAKQANSNIVTFSVSSDEEFVADSRAPE
ncbi:MAG: hypothetical protein R3192_10195 [Woeseiaceae bacterium]|nr:hypothetical protein [Woeseiaceae bacterium]